MSDSFIVISKYNREMQIGIGIPLIVLAFVVPIVAYFVYRWYLYRKARLLITGGEVFEKDSDRFGIIEDGEEHKIPVPKSVTLQNAVKKLGVW